MIIYNLHDDMVEDFFASARERYRMMLRRRAGQASTKDPILGQWFFSNVFREDDTTTRWIKAEVREPLRNDPRVMVAMMICRLFNRVETLEVLKNSGVLHDWCAPSAREVLRDTQPTMGGAYRVRTPEGMNKLDGILKIIEDNRHAMFDMATRMVPGQSTMEATWSSLSCLPFLARVVSYEVVSDLRHTYMLEQAPDICTWAAPTAGVSSGMSWLVARDPSFFHKELGKKAHQGILGSMLRLLAMSCYDELWPRSWPSWEMRDLAHWLTQYGAYCKAKHQNKTLHRRYPVGKHKRKC